MSQTSKLYRLKDFVTRANTRLVDFVHLSDSNGLYNGAGWDTGLVDMLLTALDSTAWTASAPSKMYASGLHGYGEGNGTNGGGNGVGYGVGSDGSTAKTIRYFGDGSKQVGGFVGDEAPFNISAVWHSASDPGTSSGAKNHLREVWWQSTTVPGTQPAAFVSLGVQPANPLGLGKDTTNQLQYQLWHAEWTTADAPSLGNLSFQTLRHPLGSGGGVGIGGFYTLVTHGKAVSTVNVNTPFTIDFPTDAGRLDTDGLSVRLFASASSAAQYPVAAFFHRFVRKNATSGFAVSSLYSAGGAKASDCLNYLQNVQGATCIQNYLKCLTHQQRAKSQEPCVVIPILFGTNDANGGRTKAQYKQDVSDIMAFIRTQWTTLGYSPTNLLFMVMPALPYSATDTLADYRVAARELAASYTDVCSFDVTDVISYDTLNTNYNTSTIPCFSFTSGPVKDVYHLRVDTTDSNTYRTIGQYIASEISDAQRPATGLPLATKLQVVGLLFNGVV